MEHCSQVVLQTLTAHRTALSAGVLAQEAKWGTPTDVDVILTLTVPCLKSVKMTSVLKDAGGLLPYPHNLKDRPSMSWVGCRLLGS